MDAAPATTTDALLGGRLTIRQPAQGYRVAIDPVLLAAAVDAHAGEQVLDLGAGVGAAALCLAARVEGVAVVGVELQAALVDLAVANIADNRLQSRVRAVCGDITRLAPALAIETFDHVMANPPFEVAGTGTRSEDASKDAANVEGEAELAEWIQAAFRYVKPRGSVTFVHRADRLPAVLEAFARHGGGTTVFPLWPRARVDAKRVLVQALKGSRAPARLAAGLFLHGEGGAYTAAAEAVLRDGQALRL